MLFLQKSCICKNNYNNETRVFRQEIKYSLFNFKYWILADIYFSYLSILLKKDIFVKIKNT